MWRAAISPMVLNGASTRGSFVFTGLYTSDVINGRPAGGTGVDFADFLLGYAQQATVHRDQVPARALLARIARDRGHADRGLCRRDHGCSGLAVRHHRRSRLTERC